MKQKPVFLDQYFRCVMYSIKLVFNLHYSKDNILTKSQCR